MRRLLRLSPALLLAACRSPGGGEQIVCANDEQCVIEGVVGTCEPEGFCSVPDEDCPSGKSFVGSGNCVPEQNQQDSGVDEGDEMGADESGSEEAGDGSEEEESGEDEGAEPDMPPALCGQDIGTCSKLDVMFVVDNSRSMSEDAMNIVPLLNPDVLGLFIDGPCDYHVGVVNLDSAGEWQPAECQVPGALASSGAINNGEPCFGENHPPYLLAGEEPSPLLCAFSNEGVLNSDEKQLDTILAALSPELNEVGGCNEGFLRDDAALLVLIATDEDDDDDSGTPGEAAFRTGSVGGPSDWYDALTLLKDPQHLAVFEVLHKGEAECPWMPLLSESDGTGAEFATNILEFNTLFEDDGYEDHASSIEICAEPAVVAEQSTIQATALIEALCGDSGR